MFPDESRKRQERLSEQIFWLSKRMLDKEKFEHIAVIQKLQRIYEDKFKHSYSDLFPVILQVFEKDTEYDVNYLSYNLELIRNELEVDYSEGKNNYSDIYTAFTKLCDHLNLQIGEMSVFTLTESKINDANNIIAAASEKFENASKELENANKKANSLQTELIAVLSIFAAIVITFSGSFTFLGSIMTSIKDVTYFESVILAGLVCGMVMFNAIFLMMYLVSKITERNIYARCLTSNCSCQNDNKKCKCSGLKRIRRRLPYVYYFNLVLLIGIIIDLLIWCLDLKGKLA